jgi:hypothetical protein
VAASRALGRETAVTVVGSEILEHGKQLPDVPLLGPSLFFQPRREGLIAGGSCFRR